MIEDDIVISIAGTIGASRRISADLSGVNLTENAAKVTITDKQVADPVYLEHALQLSEVQRQIRASTGQVTIGKLALFRIEELAIPLPPIEVQREFREAIREAGAMRVSLNKAFVLLNSLFASLQSRAFSGKL